MGHVCAGFLAAKKNVKVNVLTTKPESWGETLQIDTPEGDVLCGCLHKVSSLPQEVVPEAQIVLLCLPGFAIGEELLKIRPYVRPGTFVGSVFCSTGFFFEALDILGDEVPLWGFQRVPFISRTTQYGHRATLKGYKSGHNIAVERCSDREGFRQTVEHLFESPVRLLGNYYEASFTNSNPILHPARLYSMFGDWHEGEYFDHNILFYEEWSVHASELLIAMDNELFDILRRLPVSPDYLQPILEYYESTDAESLTRKIRSITGFKGITSPMRQTPRGWVPDFESRYFTEDFPYGLRYIKEKADQLGVRAQVIGKLYQWGIKMAAK